MTRTPAIHRANQIALAAWLVALLLSTHGCGPGNTPILIMLSGDMTDAESVQITPWLNGTRGDAILHDPTQSQRVLWFPEQEGGHLRLEAEGISNNLTACRTAHATAEVIFVPEFTQPTLVLLEFPPAQCLLNVEMEGIGSVTSQPAGLDCQGMTRCSGWFPRGQQVALKADHRISSRHDAWSGACQAQGATCLLRVQGSSAVQLRDMRGICSEGDWCWQNPLPQGNTLYAMWGADATHVWAVGDGGAIVKWNGTAWSPQSSGTSKGLWGVWGSDAANVWAVGEGGTIVKWNGTAWSPQNSGTSNRLYGVWGTDAANVWAVGFGGTIVKWNGTIWSPQDSGTSNWLEGVWGTDAANVWAVGSSGTIMKWNGTDWSPQPSDNSNWLRGIWGANSANVWAMGDRGTVLKWNGTAWSPQSSGASSWLWGVWGTDAANVWAVGYGGTILHYQP